MSLKRKSSSYLYLRVTAGPHKGEVFRLRLKTKSSVGREDSCHVSLSKDNHISRQHAMVAFAKNNVYIKNISSKNKLTINGKVITEAKVKNSDLIKLGNSEFKIVFKEASAQKSSSSLKPKEKSKSPRPRTVKKNKLNPVSITIIILICVLGYKFVQPTSDQQSKDSHREVSSTTANNAVTNMSSAVPQSKPKNNIHAQAEYVKGFRDFKKGQYESGLLHFQRCLTIQPRHSLCRRYLGLSKKKIQELIQYHVLLGRKYKDQKQYQACSATFRNVTFMVKDPNQKLFQEATENFKFCEKMLEGNF